MTEISQYLQIDFVNFILQTNFQTQYMHSVTLRILLTELNRISSIKSELFQIKIEWAIEKRQLMSIANLKDKIMENSNDIKEN